MKTSKILIGIPMIALAVFVLASCGKGQAPNASNQASRKNFLLIVVDTLRADYLSSYGSERVHTPHMDRLAAEGVLFENTFTHIPITGPAHAAMFVSKYPSEAGVLNNGQVLAATETCLAEALSSLGWRTAGFVSLGVLEGRFGFNQGFEVYRDDLGAAWQADARQINDKVLEWLDSGPVEPYFAFVHYCDPHEPYYSHGAKESIVEFSLLGNRIGRLDIANETLIRIPIELPPGNTELHLGSESRFRLRASIVDPATASVRVLPAQGWEKDDKGFPVSESGSLLLRNESQETRSVSLHLYLSEILTVDETIANYIAEVEFVDREIGVLLEDFQRRGLLENTLVILTSDHGEGLGEHGEIGHITQLYDSMVHVPLILNSPRDFSGPLRVSEPVSLVDLYPTVLDALGLPDSVDGPGRSLLPLLEGPDELREKYVYLETYAPEAPQNKFGLRTAKWKYIHTPETEEVELFHLMKDPKELFNLAGSSPEEVQSFRALLATLGKGANRERSRTASPLDAETIQRLKSLGYVH